MKGALKVLAILAVCGCSSDMQMTGPDDEHATVPAAAFAAVWGFVVDESGACVQGAVVRIIRGQGLDRSENQVTPCGAWDYGGGFYFNNLTPGVELTLRATAPGFVTTERTVTPTLGPFSALILVAIPE